MLNLTSILLILALFIAVPFFRNKKGILLPILLAAVVFGYFYLFALYIYFPVLLLVLGMAALVAVARLIWKNISIKWVTIPLSIASVCAMCLIGNAIHPLPETTPSNPSSMSEALEYIEKTDQEDRVSIRLMSVDVFLHYFSDGGKTELTERDAQRKAYVLEKLADGKVTTPQDQLNVAMILQHGGDSTSYRMANELSNNSFKSGYKKAEWLSKASYDRWQLSIGKPQKYGTQPFREKSK